MMPSAAPPPKLRTAPGPAGDCLRAALREGSLPEVPPFEELRRRRARRARERLALSVVGLTLLLPMGVWLLGMRSQAPMSVVAEPLVSFTVRAASSGAPVASDVAPPALPTAPGPSARPRSVPSPKVASTRHAEVEAEPQPRPQAGTGASELVASAADAGGSAKSCVELARSGAPEEAIRCYDQLARGSGVTAELALFEQARLWGKVLRQPARALAKLEDYRQRFPKGSLRAEVMLARIDWLLGAGDRGAALRAVDEALSSGLLHERSTELERLRASLRTALPATPESGSVERPQ